jgi:hypothetical protein
MLIGLSSSDFELLNSIERQMRREVGQEKDEAKQAEILELAFRVKSDHHKPPPVERRPRRRKFIPRFVDNQ